MSELTQQVTMYLVVGSLVTCAAAYGIVKAYLNEKGLV